MIRRHARHVSWVPTGLTETKPRHYREMLRVAWANRRELPFAWRILRDGVCDGCALGTSGLSDWTIPGVHLCMVRLELLELNTGPPIEHARLRDVERLAALSSGELRNLGRLSHPLRRRAGERGFTVISWDEALDTAARHLERTDPDRCAVYMTSRGITNEGYYAVQKAARAFGTPHIDNSARLCHAASTVAMAEMMGHGASTCSYSDWLGADLIVFLGANTPNNQPVTTKYLYYAKERGAEIAVVNPHREPGLARYWVPSIPESALFGTRFADHWFDVHTDGDDAFLVGVLRALIERGGIDEAFVRAHTVGFEAAREAASATSWQLLEEKSGTARSRMEDFADLLCRRPKAVFVWSMGLTQHGTSVETIRALVNVGLARGLSGAEHRGLMPIRGHSGVQGGAEVGCAPSVDAATAARWSDIWKFPVRAARGLSAVEMIEASARGDVEVFWIVGGNFLETLPNEARNRRALWAPRLRIHHDIVMSSAMLVDPSDEVLVLPATTRYESEGGGTETSTERRIIFSPEIPGRRIGEARPEWLIFGEIVARARPELADRVLFRSAADIRREIARAIPLYAGIETLAAKGDQVQWGGRVLYRDGRFETPDGKAHFAPVRPRARTLEGDRFLVSTRRGKQFNSMVHRDIDPLTDAGRDAVLMNEADAMRLNLTHAERVRLVSSAGTFTGRVHIAPIRSGNLEVHWPEAMPLIPGPVLDPESREPSYDAVVTIEKILV
jgi:molybdopterin-dependent oxidoreductase alpha subunit